MTCKIVIDFQDMFAQRRQCVYLRVIGDFYDLLHFNINMCFGAAVNSGLKVDVCQLKYLVILYKLQEISYTNQTDAFVSV